MMNTLYQKENLKNLNELKNIVPDQLQAFSMKLEVCKIVYKLDDEGVYVCQESKKSSQ